MDKNKKTIKDLESYVNNLINKIEKIELPGNVGIVITKEGYTDKEKILVISTNISEAVERLREYLQIIKEEEEFNIKRGCEEGDYQSEVAGITYFCIKGKGKTYLPDIIHDTDYHSLNKLKQLKIKDSNELKEYYHQVSERFIRFLELNNVYYKKTIGDRDIYIDFFVNNNKYKVRFSDYDVFAFTSQDFDYKVVINEYIVTEEELKEYLDNCINFYKTKLNN